MTKNPKGRAAKPELDFDSDAGFENVRRQDVGPDLPEPAPTPELPLPKWKDRKKQSMLDWLVARLTFEEEVAWDFGGEFESVDVAIRPGAGLVYVRNQEWQAIKEFEQRQNKEYDRRLIEILKTGKASSRIQKYVAHSWRLGRLKARSSLADKRKEKGWPIWLAAADVPRIMALWKRFYPEEARRVRRSDLQSEACEMAVGRWSDAASAADRKEELEAYLKRGKNDRRRLE